MQTIGILGSTGSIGTSALDVISRFPDDFRVEFLSTHSNVVLLNRQAREFKVKYVSVADSKKAHKFKKTYKSRNTRLYEGESGLCGIVKDMPVDILIVGIVGSAALLPILEALDYVKKIALANKEALVMAGGIIIEKAKKKKVKILPVDSEHSAIFQCIESKDKKEIEKIYLTGSGGPLLNVPKKYFRDITLEEAINHPKWKMGRKISIDSATMMNKGLEVIEAHHLFGLGSDRIEVLIHPEAVVHSMVEFIDGSTLAQMGEPDMRIPIQYALTYPSRCVSPVKGLMFSRLGKLNFHSPDFKKFPCLEIAHEVAGCGGTLPCVLNASNEVAVGEFLKKRIKFMDIPNSIEKVLDSHKNIKAPDLEDILEADKWARRKTEEFFNLHAHHI